MLSETITIIKCALNFIVFGTNYGRPFTYVIEETNKICLAKGEIHVHIDMNSTNYIDIVQI